MTAFPAKEKNYGKFPAGVPAARRDRVCSRHRDQSGGRRRLRPGDQRGRGLGLLALVLEGHDEGLQALAQVFQGHFVVDALAVDAKALHGCSFTCGGLSISRREIPRD